MLRVRKLAETCLKAAAYLVAGVALSNTSLASETQDWVLKKEERGVQLFARSVPDSPFLEVKAVTRLESSMQAILFALGDGDGCSKWRKMCKSSEVIKQQTPDERLIYMVLDLPWPLSDRDIVMHSLSQEDPSSKALTVTLRSVSNEYPLQKYVRAESLGHYQVVPLNSGQFEFTWVMHTDLGGEVSPGMVNGQIVSSTLSDVIRLRKLTQQ